MGDGSLNDASRRLERMQGNVAQFQKSRGEPMLPEVLLAAEAVATAKVCTVLLLVAMQSCFMLLGWSGGQEGGIYSLVSYCKVCGFVSCGGFLLARVYVVGWIGPHVLASEVMSLRKRKWP